MSLRVVKEVVKALLKVREVLKVVKSPSGFTVQIRQLWRGQLSRGLSTPEHPQSQRIIRNRHFGAPELVSAPKLSDVYHGTRMLT